MTVTPPPAARNQVVCYTIEMTGSLPSPWSVSLCSDFADVQTSNVQVHQPRVTDFRDILDDNGGFVTSAFTVSVPGVLIATIDGVDTVFSNFSAFLQAISLPRALVTISRRARTRTAVADTELLDAEVSAVLESTPSTVTIAYNVSDLIEGRKVPKRRIADNQLPSVFARKIPEKVKGQAAPFSVGHPKRHFPEDLGVTREGEAELYKYGLAPRGFMATQIQNDGVQRRYTWAEHADLNTPDRNTVRREVFKYEGSVGAYSWIYDRNQQILSHDPYSLPWEEKFHSFTTPGKIWATAPVLCQEVHPDSVGLSDGERATNTKLEDWATLGAPGDIAFFNLPDVSSLGRISQNQDDGGGGGISNREGPNAPTGIAAFVVYRPPTLGVQRFATLYLTWPEADTALFNPGGAVGVGVNEPNNFWIEGTAFYVAVLRYDPNQWIGTKFERWDFSAETQDENSPLYNGTNDTSSGQFRLAVSRQGPFDTATGDLGILWSGLRVGYLANEFDIDRKTERNPLAFDIGGRRRRDRRGNKIPTHITTETVVSATDLGEKLLVFAQGYEDDASGTYTGTANQVLENPAEYLRYIVSSSQYGTSGTVTSGFGSYGEAATRYNKWVEWAGSSAGWKGWMQLEREQLDVGRPVVDALFEGFPETHFSRKEKFRLHVWIPDPTRWSASTQLRSTPIEPMDDLLPTAEGVDFSPQADWSNVINEFEVHYDIDPESGEKRVASVDSTGSDDGYGNPWPATPLGVEAHELAFWSRQRYGLRVRRDPILLHGVSDPSTALACACHALWRDYREEITVPFPATLALHDLEFFKIVQLTDSLETQFGFKPPFWGEGVSWSDLYWIVMSRSEEEIRDGVRGLRFRLRWMPDSVGAEVLGGGGTGIAGPVSGGGFVGEIGGTLGEPQLVETP